MARIDVRVSNFPKPISHINRNITLDVSMLKLVWGAVTVGAPSFQSAVQRGLSQKARLARQALAPITLYVSQGNNYILKSQYHGLDQSEKADLSYHAGMAMAKIVAWEILRVPWLQHAGALIKSGVVEVVRAPNTNRCPDLLGQDGTGAWHVIEAKARQRSSSPTERRDYKRQALAILTLDAKPPLSRSYCLTLQVPLLRVELVDPPTESDGLHLKVDAEGLTREYYRPYRELFSSCYKHASSDGPGGPYLFVSLSDGCGDGKSLELGLPKAVVDSNFSELPRSPVEPMCNPDNEAYYGPDGVALRLVHTERSMDDDQ